MTKRADAVAEAARQLEVGRAGSIATVSAVALGRADRRALRRVDLEGRADVGGPKRSTLSTSTIVAFAAALCACQTGPV